MDVGSKTCFAYINLLMLIGLLIYAFSTRLSSRQPFNDVRINREKTKCLYAKMIKVARPLAMIPVGSALLGLIRHDGLVPWDTSDVELSIGDKSKFKLLESSLRDEGVGMDDFGVYLLESPTDSRIIVSEYIMNSDKITIGGVTVKATDIFPLRTNLFEGIPVDMPNNPDSILLELYGKDWETVCLSGGHSVACSNVTIKDPKYLATAWVINLASRSDRWLKASEQLDSRGIRAVRWNAVDAKSESFKVRYSSIPLPKRSAPEIACGDSHCAVWKHLYELGVPYGMIFEDDIMFPDSIGLKDIEKAMAEGTGFDVIQLGHCGPFIERFVSPAVKVGSTNCLHAYIVSREGLRKLLSMPPQQKDGIDEMVNKLCHSGLCFVSRHVPMIGSGVSGIIHQDGSSESNLEATRGSI